MKKLLLILFTLLLLVGCEDSPIKIVQLEETSQSTPNIGEQYVVTLEIKQSHFTLDPFEVLKDNMNAIELPILVSKEYYEAVEVGTVLDNSFRVGSFIMNGSIGNWNITVIKKEILKE